jgi:hypothetical protein
METVSETERAVELEIGGMPMSSAPTIPAPPGSPPARPIVVWGNILAAKIGGPDRAPLQFPARRLQHRVAAYEHHVVQGDPMFGSYRRQYRAADLLLFAGGVSRIICRPVVGVRHHDDPFRS